MAAPAPTTIRSRGLRVGILTLPGLPGRPETELLLVLALGDRRRELYPFEAFRGFEQGNEGARRVGLAHQLDPLAIQGQPLQPGSLRQGLGQLTQDR